MATAGVEPASPRSLSGAPNPMLPRSGQGGSRTRTAGYYQVRFPDGRSYPHAERVYQFHHLTVFHPAGLLAGYLPARAPPDLDADLQRGQSSGSQCNRPWVRSPRPVWRACAACSRRAAAFRAGAAGLRLLPRGPDAERQLALVDALAGQLLVAGVADHGGRARAGGAEATVPDVFIAVAEMVPHESPRRVCHRESTGHRWGY